VELTDAALGKVFFSHPLLTIKVVVEIRLEALAGKRLQIRPPPSHAVTYVARRVHK
jgi:DUF1365 family protein